MSSPAFCLMGPTASGKTDLAIHLHRLFPVEIISVDSVMVYRGMNIGSAKPESNILAEAPHHLIDIREPYEVYSAAQFCEDAAPLIAGVLKRGKIPLLTGGTMLYFHALQQGLSGLPSADADIRAQLMQRAAEEGWPVLHSELLTVDPDAARRIHPNDAQRIQRALEVFRLSGKPMSELQENRQDSLEGISVCNIVVAPDNRDCLHDRIARRFEQMLEMGLVSEVEKLLADDRVTPELPAMRSAGYRQVCAYLAGEISESELPERGIIATRQLAKRQLTWLRHWGEETVWFDSENPDVLDGVAGLMEKTIRELKK